MAKIISTSTQDFKEAAKYAKELGKEIYKQINDSDLVKNFLTEMKRPKIGGAALETIESAATYLIKDKDRLEHLIKSFKGKEAYEQKDAADIQKIIDKLIDVQKIIPPAGIFMDENNKAIGELKSFQKKNESLAQDSGLSL